MFSVVPETIAYMLLLFFFLSVGLCIGLASFAFSDPIVFARWIPPMSALFSRLSNRASKIYSFSMGIGFLGLTMGLSFLFGSLTISFSMNMWSSPFIRWLEKLMN